VLVARPTRVDFPGARYHVLNRGTEKRAILRSRRGYEKFIELLGSVLKRFAVRLHGYVLMGNHCRGKNFCTRGGGARETALLLGRGHGRLSFKEPGKLASGIRDNAASIVSRRLSERLPKDRALHRKFSLVQKALNQS
jgi:hypothetical protein